MKRKPDLLWILVILFGLGIVTTGYAQSLWANKSDATPMEITQQQQKKPGKH
jgi:type IV secretory pathway TrbD component